MPPNILIFMTDHQRADTISSDHPARMPNLDSFMKEAVNFTQAYCPAPHCCPSRASFFSGLYPSGHGVWNNVANEQALSRGLNDGVRLFSEDLAASGYDLYFSGKWHVSHLERPADRGWNELFVSSGPDAYHGRTWGMYHQGVATDGEPRPGYLRRPGYGDFQVYGTGDEAGNAHDEQVVKLAVDKLNDLGQATTQTKPWCMYVGVNAPHDPYVVPQRYLDLYDLNDVPLPPNYSDPMTDKPGLYRRLKEQVFGQLSEHEVRNAIRHFWAFCSYVDDLFGQVLEALETSGQAEETLVLFCADHGDYCGEHGLFAKGIPCFEGAYHVPAVIRFPGGVAEPGRSVSEFVSLTDFAPTFLEVAGIKSDRRFSGRSLVPFLKNQQPEGWRDSVFTQCNGVELYYLQRSITTKTHKYVFNGFDFDELYDRATDPYELHNRIGDSTLDATKRELLRELWRFAHSEGDTSALNPYVTVGLAPWGPAEAFLEGQGVASQGTRESDLE